MTERNFKPFAQAVKKSLDRLTKENNLYRTDVDIIETYLSAFPTDERQHYNCSCCKNFLRDVGNLVTIKNGKIQSIWDSLDLDDNVFSDVVKELSSAVTKAPLREKFFCHQAKVGAEKTLDAKRDLYWNHFFGELPNSLVNKEPGPLHNEHLVRVNRFKKGLDVNIDSLNDVLELCRTSSIEKASQMLPLIKGFIPFKEKYDKLKDSQKEIFVWENAYDNKSQLEGSVIFTLIKDIDDGIDIDDAVHSYESKVNPLNYQRSKSVITEGMTKNALKKIAEMGIEDSLYRMHARVSDLSVRDILWANRTSLLKMKNSISEILSKEIAVTDKDFSKTEEISLDSFIKTVLPKISSLEAYVENRHTNQFMSLTTAVNPDSQRLFKWDSPIAWSYVGEVTDSVQERVKAAGGTVDAFIRVSLSWFNFDDLDLHLIERLDGHRTTEIQYNNKVSSITGGCLDVDMNAGSGKTRNAVENIFYKNKSQLKKGWYDVNVYQFSKRETVDFGFSLQFAYGEEIKNLHYDKFMNSGDTVYVLSFHWDGNKIDQLVIHPNIITESASKEFWGIKTQNWTRVNIVTVSPNFWESEIGNKHHFFILNRCKNPDPVRGFYNEFLRPELHENRKTFEVLASRMKADYAEDQLSGIGFSIDRRNDLLVRTKGSFTRTLRIKF